MAAEPRLLSRDEVLARRANLPSEVVDVPDLGGAVTVRALSGTDRDRYEAGMLQFNAKGQVQAVKTDGKRARLVWLSVFNADGSRMFKESDLLAIGDLDGNALDLIIATALRLSKMTDAAVEESKNGLKADQNGSSGSDSPES